MMNNQIMATGGEDQKVNLWRVTNAANFWSLSGHSSAIDCLCFDPTENYVVSGSHGGTLKVYDLEEVSSVPVPRPMSSCSIGSFAPIQPLRKYISLDLLLQTGREKAPPPFPTALVQQLHSLFGLLSFCRARWRAICRATGQP